jgi:Flp pilus assembly protein CpaB
MTRTVCLAVFLVLSAIAGFFYYANTEQASALVATHDLTVGTQLHESDVAIRRVNPSSIGSDVFRGPDQAVGQYVAFPVLKGQFLDPRQITASKNAELLGIGLRVPAGSRIIGVPVTPATAVGGALKPGDLVDVIAVPTAQKTGIAVEDASIANQTIGRDVLVVGLRTEQGTAFDRTDPGINATGAKPGSVLLAIPESDEGRYSGAMGTSTFLLALSTD